jgi:hypothetical protein
VSCDTDTTTLDPIVQTADYSYGLEVSERSESGVVTPVDLTGAIWRAQLRRTPASDSVLATFSVSVTAVGKATLSLNQAQTAVIPASPCESGWAHDVFVTLPDGRDLNVVPLTLIPVIAATSRA